MLIKQFKSGIISLFAASMTLPVAAPAIALISTTSEESIATSKQEYSLIAHDKVHHHNRRRAYTRRKNRHLRRRSGRYRNRYRDSRYRRYRRYRKSRRYSRCRIQRRYGNVYRVCSYN